MDLDFSTKAGWQKAIITLAGIASTVLMAAFGWSPDKANTFVTVATQYAPIVATIGFWIVNQIAAKGKAATTVKLAELEVDKVAAANTTTVMTSTTSASSGDATMVSVPAFPKASELPETVTSLVKDRVEVAMKIAATDEGMKDVLMGKFSQRTKESIKHFSDLNPTIGGLDAAEKVVEDMYKVRLDAKQCAVIQSMIGLPQAIFAKTDETIMANIIGSWDRDPVGTASNKEMWRKIAIDWAKSSEIREAADRVKNVMLPMDKRVLALMEFGVTPEDAARSGREGMSRVWYTIPGGTGATPVDFGDGYWLLGMTP
jgi:hypothetical protein